MGCLTFETAVENKSLAAFSLFVISGDSPVPADMLSAGYEHQDFQSALLTSD